MSSLGSSNNLQRSVGIGIYTLVLLLVQALWISRLSYPALRADLLLPLMFGIAAQWRPLASLGWAFLWGFAVDTLSGKFWGFHVGSYVATVCLVNVAGERFELNNPLYQMALVGICALAQSTILGFYLVFEPHNVIELGSLWRELTVRSLFIMLLSPFIIYPLAGAPGSMG